MSMKKTFFFIPAILLTAYCGGLACGAGAASVGPVLWVGLLLLWGSGILLSRGFIWGAFCGVLPGLLMIYQGTQGTETFLQEGLPFGAELSVGMALLLFYMFCVCALYERS